MPSEAPDPQPRLAPLAFRAAWRCEHHAAPCAGLGMFQQARRALCILALLLGQHVQAASEVLPLHYRTADELLPTLQSVLGEAGKISAYDNQLVVTAEPEGIQTVRELLQQLDTPAQRLLITLDISDSADDAGSGYRIEGRAQGGPVVLEAGESSGSRARILRHSTDQVGSGRQQIQVTEGYPALIQVGQRVPLTSTGSDVYGRLYQDTQYQDATRGFYVTARVSGDIVHVTISANDDRPSQQPTGSLDRRATATQVSGRLGEWIYLSSNSATRRATQSGYLHQYSTDSQDDFSLRLKVDRLE